MGTPASGGHPHPVVHPKVHLFIVLQHESLTNFFRQVIPSCFQFIIWFLVYPITGISCSRNVHYNNRNNNRDTFTLETVRSCKHQQNFITMIESLLKAGEWILSQYLLLLRSSVSSPIFPWNLRRTFTGAIAVETCSNQNLKSQNVPCVVLPQACL